MEVIVFSNRDNSLKTLLLEEISHVPDLKYRMIFDFDALFETAPFKLSDVVMVFLISFEHELDLLISNKRRLFHSRVVLILPDAEKTMVSKGLSLRPRYMAQWSDRFKDVAAVLNKMVQNRKSGDT